MNFFEYTDDQLVQLREILAENLDPAQWDVESLSDTEAVALGIMNGIIAVDEDIMYNIRGSLAEQMQVPMDSLQAITDEGIVEMAARYGVL
jgi:hypothetical protein